MIGMIIAVTSVVLFLMLAAEFIIGWRRGLKKSLIRLAVVAVMAGISFLLTVILTEKILLAIIQIAGLSGETLSGALSPALEKFVSAESAGILAPALSGLAVSVISPVIFLVFFWLLKLLSWIVFAIIYKVRNKSTVSEAIDATVKIETSVDVEAEKAEPKDAEAVKEIIVNEAKTHKKDNVLGAAVGVLIGAITVACAVSFFIGDVQYIAEIVPAAVDVVSEKAPETKEEINAFIDKIEALAEKGIDFGAIADSDKLKIAEDTIKENIGKISDKLSDIASSIKFDSTDTLKSDLHAIADILRWLNDNDLLKEGSDLIDKLSTLGKDKVNELYDKLSSLSFGEDVIKNITSKLIVEAVGEEYAEKADEILESFENPEELKAAIVEIVDVAPIISDIESGKLSDEETDQVIDDALAKIKESPLIDADTYAQIEAKVNEMRENGGA